jgi:hypothetical protein
MFNDARSTDAFMCRGMRFEDNCKWRIERNRNAISHDMSLLYESSWNSPGKTEKNHKKLSFKYRGALLRPKQFLPTVNRSR